VTEARADFIFAHAEISDVVAVGATLALGIIGDSFSQIAHNIISFCCAYEFIDFSDYRHWLW
jgi:hypothetical protein